MPAYKDVVDSSNSNFKVDNLDDTGEADVGLSQWCMRPESFAPVHMQMDELAHYYRKSSWNSSSVDFVRSRDNFIGPKPGFKCPQVGGIPQPDQVFNLYWSDRTLDHIITESNWYARATLPHKPNELPRTKGGLDWVDVNRVELRGWIGICILMGCKRLPSLRHY